MKKTIFTFMFIVFFNGITVSRATEAINIKASEKPMLKEVQLNAMRTYNLPLWALLKDVQNIGAVAHLNIKELENRFNFGQPFLPIDDTNNADLHKMQPASYYTEYVSNYNSVKYYLTIRTIMSNRYPIESENNLLIHLNILPSLNQCIKRTGLDFVFNKDLIQIVPFPPQFIARGITEEERSASVKFFQNYHRTYSPSLYISYKSDAQSISFAFATNGCLLSVHL
jgi:hypothetical protein